MWAQLRRAQLFCERYTPFLRFFDLVGDSFMSRTACGIVFAMLAAGSVQLLFSSLFNPSFFGEEAITREWVQTCVHPVVANDTAPTEGSGGTRGGFSFLSAAADLWLSQYSGGIGSSSDNNNNIDSDRPLNVQKMMAMMMMNSSSPTPLSMAAAVPQTPILPFCNSTNTTDGYYALHARFDVLGFSNVLAILAAFSLPVFLVNDTNAGRVASVLGVAVMLGGLLWQIVAFGRVMNFKRTGYANSLFEVSESVLMLFAIFASCATVAALAPIVFSRVARRSLPFSRAVDDAAALEEATTKRLLCGERRLPRVLSETFARANTAAGGGNGGDGGNGGNGGIGGIGGIGGGVAGVIGSLGIAGGGDDDLAEEDEDYYTTDSELGVNDGDNDGYNRNIGVGAVASPRRVHRRADGGRSKEDGEQVEEKGILLTSSTSSGAPFLGSERQSRVDTKDGDRDGNDEDDDANNDNDRSAQQVGVTPLAPVPPPPQSQPQSTSSWRRLRFRARVKRALLFLWTGSVKTAKQIKTAVGGEANPHRHFETAADFRYPMRLICALIYSMWLTVFSGLIFLSILIPISDAVLTLLQTKDIIEDWLFKLLKRLIPAGLILSAAVGWVVILGVFLHLSRRFRRQSMMLRRGKYFFDKQEVVLTDASRYIGYQASHAVGIYVVVILTCVGLITVIVLAIVLPGFARDILDEIWLFVRDVLLSVLLIAWAQRLVVTFVFSSHRGSLLRHRNVYALVDYVLIFVNIVQGSFVAGRRIATGFGRILVLFGRIDIQLYNGDPAWLCYVAMVWSHHTYHNPVANTASRVLMRIVRECDGGKTPPSVEERYYQAPLLESSEQLGGLSGKGGTGTGGHRDARSLRARTRWHLAVTLINNPSVRPLRKRILALQRERQRMIDREAKRAKRQLRLERSQKRSRQRTKVTSWITGGRFGRSRTPKSDAETPMLASV